ncbi:MAG: beta-galactosidase trimerization domain-containing protein, partial [Bacteroidia bacterium]
PEVGLASSFPSQIASNSFPELQDQQLQTCWNLFYFRNMDSRVVEISKSSLNYKLVFIPGVTVMDEITANKIRDFVKNGGTVVMTNNSAVVDETGKVFASTHPGRLNYVFGIRVASYEETENMNEISHKSLGGKKIELNYQGKTIGTESTRYDVIESKGAEVLGSITSLDKDYPIITSNKYGKGRAIYVGLPASAEVLGPLLDKLVDELGIKKGPEVPDGVMARQIDKNHVLYLNTGRNPAEIRLKGAFKGILSGKAFVDSFTLPSEEPELIEIN